MIPHITGLTSESLTHLLATSDLIVIGKAVEGLDAALQEPTPRQVILDLTRRWDRRISNVGERPILRIG